jgi:hypothetical protein
MLLTTTGWVFFGALCFIKVITEIRKQWKAADDSKNITAEQ